MTNTYKPFIGGVEASVEIFSNEYRRRGHNVLIVTPTFENAPAVEEGVFRFPAIQNFNGSDFSVKLPIPGILSKTLDTFKPDIVHSHHPFLMGDTALRIAASYAVPIVFTFHTFFERYTHYVPGDSPPLKRFVASLATGYANLCDHVIAPSESVLEQLRERGVTTPTSIAPTGIYVHRFAHGEGATVRRRCGIAREAFVAGFVSRLAPEKNIDFLCLAVTQFLKHNSQAHFMVVGKGPSQNRMQELFLKAEIRDRVHFLGLLEGQELTDAYHAMDLFVFASHTETQGIVLAEAMAAGIPVVAVAASGVREVVTDRENGRLIDMDDQAVFADAIRWYKDLPRPDKNRLKRHAREAAAQLSVDRCVETTLSIYRKVAPRFRNGRQRHDSGWAEAIRRVHAEWELLVNTTKATGAAMRKRETSDQLSADARKRSR